MMIQYIRNLDRPEGSQTHMKCDMRDLDAHFLNLCQQFLGKMKSGSRSSRGSPHVLHKRSDNGFYLSDGV